MEIVIEPEHPCQAPDTIQEKVEEHISALSERIRQSVQAISEIYSEAELLCTADPSADAGLTAMACHNRARRLDALNEQVTRIFAECPSMPSHEELGAFDLQPHIERFDRMADERWLTEAV